MLISTNVNKIAAIIQQGGIVAYPTEAVFGLGCDPHNPAAVQRLLALKQRSETKGLIVIAANLTQLANYITDHTENHICKSNHTQFCSDTDLKNNVLERSALEKKLISKQNSPTTWLVPAHEKVPKWVTGQYSSVAVRISTHPACQQLCLAVAYPIISTSANPSSCEPARDITTLQTYFESNHQNSTNQNQSTSTGIDAIFDAPLGNYQRPSIIRDAVTNQVIR
jgi:L-threonylcarbamoyladenylate synthase